MEVDGPESPDMMPVNQDLNYKEEECFEKRIFDDGQHQQIAQDPLIIKAKIIFDKLESMNELNLTKKLSLALTAEITFEKNLEILIKLFDFYKYSKQFQMAQNLFSNLVQNFTFQDTVCFDSQLQYFALTIILYNHRMQNEKKSLNVGSVDCFKKLIQSDEYEFYLSLYQSQSLRIQEKLIVQLLDKYRSLFQFTKQNTENESNTSLIKEYYKIFAINELKFNLFKYLLKSYTKYLPTYGLKLVDFVFNAEKQCFPSTNSAIESNENGKRSLNLFRKLCIIDLIPTFVSLIETKLDNKTYYRWIEKSLEFYTKYTFNATYVQQVNPSTQSIQFGYKEVKLIQV